MSDSAPDQWCMVVCVCSCSVLSDSLSWSSRIWVCAFVCLCVCVLSRVQLFALEQWFMGVCACVCVWAQLCPTLCTGAVAYGFVRVYVYAHSCPTLCTGTVADVCVFVCVCTCSVVSDILCQSNSGWLCVCVLSHV